MAQSGHIDTLNRCPLLGVKRISARLSEISAYDPKRTLEAGRLRVTNERNYQSKKCDSLLIPDVVLGTGEAMRRREFIASVSSAQHNPLSWRRPAASHGRCSENSYMR